jgi:hypothetical protein
MVRLRLTHGNYSKILFQVIRTEKYLKNNDNNYTILQTHKQDIAIMRLMMSKILA